MLDPFIPQLHLYHTVTLEYLIISTFGYRSLKIAEQEHKDTFIDRGVQRTETGPLSTTSSGEILFFSTKNGKVIVWIGNYHHNIMGYPCDGNLPIIKLNFLST